MGAVKNKKCMSILVSRPIGFMNVYKKTHLDTTFIMYILLHNLFKTSNQIK